MSLPQRTALTTDDINTIINLLKDWEQIPALPQPTIKNKYYRDQYVKRLTLLTEKYNEIEKILHPLFSQAWSDVDFFDKTQSE
jgi:uncharacterized protein YmfQ (DUF2313 family)